MLSDLWLTLRVWVFAKLCADFFQVIDIWETDGGAVGMVMGETYCDCAKMVEAVEIQMRKRNYEH